MKVSNYLSLILLKYFTIIDIYIVCTFIIIIMIIIILPGAALSKLKLEYCLI